MDEQVISATVFNDGEIELLENDYERCVVLLSKIMIQFSLISFKKFRFLIVDELN
jgi:hypothetical protein